MRVFALPLSDAHAATGANPSDAKNVAFQNPNEVRSAMGLQIATTVPSAF
jgi:hypothetical protein